MLKIKIHTQIILEFVLFMVVRITFLRLMSNSYRERLHTKCKSNVFAVEDPCRPRLPSSLFKGRRFLGQIVYNFVIVSEVRFFALCQYVVAVGPINKYGPNIVPVNLYSFILWYIQVCLAVCLMNSTSVAIILVFSSTFIVKLYSL